MPPLSHQIGQHSIVFAPYPVKYSTIFSTHEGHLVHASLLLRSAFILTMTDAARPLTIP